MLWGDTIYTGLFLQKREPTLDEQEPVLEEGGPLTFRPTALTKEQSARVIKRMM